MDHYLKLGLDLGSRGTLSNLLLGLFFVWITYNLGNAVYLIYFYPLSRFPGPPLAAVSNCPAVFWTFRGSIHHWLAKQHARYGPIVRIRPHELSVIGESAWKDIYAHRQGQHQMQKVLRTKPFNGAPSLMSANDVDHARQRKLLSNAFSDTALREHEPVLQSYADLLVKQVREESKASSSAIDMVEWLTFTTFDIIGDLSFGASFGNLANKRAHPWVSTLKSGVKQSILLTNFRSLLNPYFDKLFYRLLSPMLQKQRHEQWGYTQTAVRERLKRKTDRSDFISNLLRFNDINSVPQAEVEGIFTIIALAGCESPATALSGALYHLLRHQSAYKKLQDEIRIIPTDDDITLATVSRLSYLKAALDESMRLYPAVPTAMDRVVPGDGATICGHWVPGGTWVGIPQVVAYHSPLNFSEPNSFIPERYLEKHDSRYDGDKPAVVQPFSSGPRNCIGQNLARAEMRLILAKLIWHFDMELDDPKTEWTKQSVWGMWDTTPLMVKVTPRF